MERLLQDLRFAFRLFRKDRAFALTTILTLALCIGANTAIFTVVRSVLLRPLPYPESDRLVFLYESFPGAGVERAGTSVPNYFDRLAFTDVFESQALYQSGGFRVGQGAGAEGVASMSVSPSFFNVLKTSAARGRGFIEDEGTPGKNRVTVLSWSFAKRQPGGVDGIVGRELVHERRALHRRRRDAGDVYVSQSRSPALGAAGVYAPKSAATDRRYSQNHDEDRPPGTGRHAGAGAAETRCPEREKYRERRAVEVGARQRRLSHARCGRSSADLVRNVRAALQMLWGGVACLLLIAAVNITNLSLARATGRLKEVATRHALGAARGPRRPSAGDRNDAADVDRRCARPGAWLLEPWRIDSLWGSPTFHARTRSAWTRSWCCSSSAGGCARRDRRRRAGHAHRRRQPQRRPARGRPNGHGRPRRTRHTQRARRRAGRVGVRAAHRRRAAHGELPRAPAERRSRIQNGTRVDGSSVAARGALSRRQRACGPTPAVCSSASVRCPASRLPVPRASCRSAGTAAAA